MTIPYSHDAATARIFTLFRVLFFRWDGSVWQLIQLELIVWSIAYLAIHRIYCHILNVEAQHYVKFLVKTIKVTQSPSMVHFLLGFFTMITVNRWWNVYGLMEWPDSVSQSLAAHLRRSTTYFSAEKVQILRRTMAKHLQLAFVLLLRDISGAMRKRFPYLESLNQSNLLMNEQEMMLIKYMEFQNRNWCLYWMPFQWLFLNLKKFYFVDFKTKLPANKRTQNAYKASLFSNKFEYLHVVKELIAYRTRMGRMLEYDACPAPTLAFTQAIIFAVYGFIFFAIFENLSLDDVGNNYLIIFVSIVKIGIYLAWLKCTIIMINPFGSDKDDFELIWLTDRHWRVIYRILDDPWQLFPVTTFTRTHHGRKRSVVEKQKKDFKKGKKFKYVRKISFRLKKKRAKAGCEESFLEEDSCESEDE